MLRGLVLLALVASCGSKRSGEEQTRDCLDKQWMLITPEGRSEMVPTRYVRSAILKKNYTLPKSAETVGVLPPDKQDVPCPTTLWYGPAEKIGEVLSDGYDFREYREATPEEREKRALEGKFGAPSQ